MSNRLAEILKPKWEREPVPSGRVRLSNFEIDMPDLRKLWGDDIVDKRLANGTIKILEEENMPDDTKPRYDCEFIYLSFNLIPLFGGKSAIAPGAITDIRLDAASDEWVINLHGGARYMLSHPQMAELEAAIKARKEVLAEANNRVAPVHGQIVDPRGRRH
jgi:hypothetical protein